MPALPAKRGRGHLKVYSNRLFLKAVVTMIACHLHTAYKLLSVLAQPTEEIRTLRLLLNQQEPFPSRSNWERRLKAILVTLPAQIGCLGRHLIDLIRPWATCGRAIATNSTMLRSCGVCHQQHREKGEVPHTSIDTQAHWTKSSWHGRVYIWKLHFVSVVAVVLNPANIAESNPTLSALHEVPAEIRFVLRNRHYNTPELHEDCEQAHQLLVTTRYGRYPHTDDWGNMRHIFYKLHSIAMEILMSIFKGIIDEHGQVPIRACLLPNALP